MRRGVEVGTQESVEDARCLEQRGTAGLNGGDPRAYGESQTTQNLAKAHEHVDQTVEGSTENRRICVRCGGQRHGTFAGGAYSVDAAVCRRFAQRHR